MPEISKKPWMIRDLPSGVRRRIKIYAAEKGITLAEAITEIVYKALEKDT